MNKTILVPIVMRGDNHEDIKVGTAKYDINRGAITARIDMDTLQGQYYLLGRGIDLGLVAGLRLSVEASDFGLAAVEAATEAEENAVVEELTEQ